MHSIQFAFSHNILVVSVAIVTIKTTKTGNTRKAQNVCCYFYDRQTGKCLQNNGEAKTQQRKLCKSILLITKWRAMNKLRVIEPYCTWGYYYASVVFQFTHHNHIVCMLYTLSLIMIRKEIPKIVLWLLGFCWGVVIHIQFL